MVPPLHVVPASRDISGFVDPRLDQDQHDPDRDKSRSLAEMNGATCPTPPVAWALVGRQRWPVGRDRSEPPVGFD